MFHESQRLRFPLACGLFTLTRPRLSPLQQRCRGTLPLSFSFPDFRLNLERSVIYCLSLNNDESWRVQTVGAVPGPRSCSGRPDFRQSWRSGGNVMALFCRRVFSLMDDCVPDELSSSNAGEARAELARSNPAWPAQKTFLFNTL